MDCQIWQANAKSAGFALQQETLDGYRVQRNVAARFTPPGGPLEALDSQLASLRARPGPRTARPAPHSPARRSQPTSASPSTEGPANVNPDSPREQQLTNIRRIYGPEKEALGVLAIEIERVAS